ncbi:MAG TPA: hypothetical protein DEH05_18370, partial [Propionibacteriaceae bacterium]|nr:hypothetical protein [Propionibacteriaceae bacterium]
HLVDPIRFQKRIKVTFEHGHGNHLSDEWSSTAYWYQTLPSPQLTIPEVDDRLPLRPIDRVITTPLPTLSEAQQAARAAAADRMKHFVERRNQLHAERRAEVDQWEHANTEIAADIRRRFDQGQPTA